METPQPNQEYLQKHPDAVQDVDKAHLMALAADYHETEAIADMKRSEANIDALGMPANSFEAGDAYNARIQGVVEGESSSAVDDMRLSRAEHYAASARVSRAMANDKAEEAGIRYDKGQEILSKLK